MVHPQNPLTHSSQIKTGYRPRMSTQFSANLPGFSTNSNHSSDCSLNSSSYNSQPSNNSVYHSAQSQNNSQNFNTQVDNLCNTFALQNFGFISPEASQTSNANNNNNENSLKKSRLSRKSSSNNNLSQSTQLPPSIPQSLTSSPHPGNQIQNIQTGNDSSTTGNYGSSSQVTFGRIIKSWSVVCIFMLFGLGEELSSETSRLV